jgi:peptidoglycan/LPS O-acetylase OafA/YrhL
MNKAAIPVMNASSNKLSHILALDGVRGMAALMIMIFHYWQGDGFHRLGFSDSFGKVAVFGQTGVDLFFVLSGFLITRILISTKDSPNYFRNFYGRRALRILPLYYFFLVIYYFIVPWLEKTPVDAFRTTWWYWFYLQNVPDTFNQLHSAGPFQYWSLAVEEHFYMIWPLIVYFAPVRSLERFSLVLIGAAIIFRAIFIFGFKVGVFYFTLCRMDALAFGTLLACLEATGLLVRYRKAGMILLVSLLPVLVI